MANKSIESCVAMVLNKEFLPGFIATINSIKENTPNFNEHLIVLDIDLDDTTKSECKKHYSKIKFVKVQHDNYTKLPKHAPALTNAFFKLDLFRLAKHFDRIVFCDCDIIFVKSISSLLQKMPQADIMLTHRPHDNVYNTGVMVFKRADASLYPKIIKFMKSMSNGHLGDQAVITECIRKNILTFENLPMKWNTTKRDAITPKFSNFIGLHYVGKKPWKGGEPGYEDIEKLWFKYGG